MPKVIANPATSPAAYLEQVSRYAPDRLDSTSSTAIGETLKDLGFDKEIPTSALGWFTRRRLSSLTRQQGGEDLVKDGSVSLKRLIGFENELYDGWTNAVRSIGFGDAITQGFMRGRERADQIAKALDQADSVIRAVQKIAEPKSWRPIGNALAAAAKEIDRAATDRTWNAL
jgi:hypothetical protein